MYGFKLFNKNKNKKKGNCQIVDFAIPADHRVKIKENKKSDKYLVLARELKTMKHENDGDNWCAQNNPQRLGKGTERLRNQRTSGDHPDYSIIKISQNTEKSPGDLLSLKFQQKTIS